MHNTLDRGHQNIFAPKSCKGERRPRKSAPYGPTIDVFDRFLQQVFQYLLSNKVKWSPVALNFVYHKVDTDTFAAQAKSLLPQIIINKYYHKVFFNHKL